jgi:hypothetical protein
VVGKLEGKHVQIICVAANTVTAVTPRITVLPITVAKATAGAAVAAAAVEVKVPQMCVLPIITINQSNTDGT